MITEQEIAAIIDKLGDPTTTELGVEYNRERRGKARVHVSSIKRALHRHGYVIKNADGLWRVCARSRTTRVTKTRHHRKNN
jgi:hypothetical protein